MKHIREFSLLSAQFDDRAFDAMIRRLLFLLKRHSESHDIQQKLLI
jgi:hypothetical protein